MNSLVVFYQWRKSIKCGCAKLQPRSSFPSRLWPEQIRDVLFWEPGQALGELGLHGLPACTHPSPKALRTIHGCFCPLSWPPCHPQAPRHLPGQQSEDTVTQMWSGVVVTWDSTLLTATQLSTKQLGTRLRPGLYVVFPLPPPPPPSSSPSSPSLPPSSSSSLPVLPPPPPSLPTHCRDQRDTFMLCSFLISRWWLDLNALGQTVRAERRPGCWLFISSGMGTWLASICGVNLRANRKHPSPSPLPSSPQTSQAACGLQLWFETTSCTGHCSFAQTPLVSGLVAETSPSFSRAPTAQRSETTGPSPGGTGLVPQVTWGCHYSVVVRGGSP